MQAIHDSVYTTFMDNEVQPDELKRVFRENMRERRLRLNMTQAQMAEAMGVAQAYISDLESGRKRPMVDTLATIAEALKTTPARLLTPRIPAT